MPLLCTDHILESICSTTKDLCKYGMVYAALAFCNTQLGLCILCPLALLACVPLFTITILIHIIQLRHYECFRFFGLRFSIYDVGHCVGHLNLHYN